MVGLCTSADLRCIHLPWILQNDIHEMDRLRILALVRNRIVDLSAALPALVEVTQKSDPQLKVLAAQVLAYLQSPDAQNWYLREINP